MAQLVYHFTQKIMGQLIEQSYDYDCGSDSSDETNQEIDSNAAKTCGCALGDNGDPCGSTTKIEVIFDCRKNLAALIILFINYVQRLSLRTHGNKSWRLPSSAISAEAIQRVVKFFMNVAEDQVFFCFQDVFLASKELTWNYCQPQWQNLVFGKDTKVRRD